jgi:hypothetical protein
MKAIILLTLCVSLAAAFDLSWLDFNGDINFRFALLGFKGFMYGLQKGVYADEFFNINPQCLTTPESNERMTFIYEFINGRGSPLLVL